MNKITKIIVGVVVIVLVVWAIVAKTGSKSSAPLMQSSTIKVGIIAPLTGTASSYGTEGKNSVVLALDEINANGGIAGKKVEYVIEDGKCEATAAINAWNKLVNVDKVQAVFGGHCSTETLTIAPLTAKDHVPAFAVFTTSPNVANEGEWVFRHVSTNAYYGTALADQAYAKGYKNIAVLTEVKDFPVTYSDAFIKEFKARGGTVTLHERFDPGTKDYRTVALKLKDVKYDAVFVSTQGADVSGILASQIKTLSLDKAFLFTHTFSPTAFLKGSNGYMPKSILAITPYSDENSASVKEYNAKYVQKYGKMYDFGNFFEIADYDIVYRYKNAAEACVQDGNASGFSTDCVRDQFKKATSYNGAAGNVTISSQYSPHGVLTPIGFIKVTNGVQSFELIK